MVGVCQQFWESSFTDRGLSRVEGWRGKAEVGRARGRRRRGVGGRGVEIARREATDVRVNAITLHLCSKLS